MRCKSCEYPLWNLTARVCPECGGPFLPSDFEFVRGAVRYCCPRCAQAYYGTDARGHLEPRAFTCVSCGDALEMDRMVLLPYEQAPQHLIEKVAVPWLETRRRGVFRAFFSTIGWAMVKPGQLGRDLPANSSVFPAILFALLVLLVVAVLTASPLLLVALAPTGRGLTAAAISGGTTVAVVLLGGLVYVLLWGCSAHLLLRLTGRVAGPLGRTVELCCYATGAAPVSGLVLLCLAPYVCWVWPVVSATIALTARQRVAGWRASLACLALPVATIAVLIGLWVYVIYGVMSAAGVAAGATLTGPGMAQGVLVRTQVASALESYESRTGSWPGHGAELLVGGGLTPGDFLATGSATDLSRVFVGGADLDSLQQLPAAQASQALAAAAAANAGRPAHRVGDIVFTYGGLPSPPVTFLWVAVVWPDPAQNSSPPDRVVVMTISGIRQNIAPEDFDRALATQNRIRTNLGYPAIPHPRDVAAEPAPTLPEGG